VLICVVEVRSIQKVLIFRIGSIGDTVVALPCLHQVARAFPGHRRVLVTDVPSGQKAAAADSILRRGTLIDDVIYFPPPPRKWRDLIALGKAIRQTRARDLIYIADRRVPQILRDISFFYACGIRRMIGVPLKHDMRKPRIDPVSGDLEREAERLARCLGGLGPVDLDDPRAWDLCLQPDELQTAKRALAPLAGRDFIAMSIGGKDPSKDWGDENWIDLFRSMSLDWPQLALVFIGASSEAARARLLAKHWPGQKLNLCGDLTPRESAAAMQSALCYVGHDTGPMHLAAAVGVPCVALFGDFNEPKWWHPMGSIHEIIHDMRGVRLILPEQVREGVLRTLRDKRGVGARCGSSDAVG
jgi:ADP-heptose:LPS heptosyltransferase